MSIFGLSRNQELSDWRDAAGQSGYGIKMDAPPIPYGMKLFSHLNISGRTRRRLQKMLVKYWTVRPEGLIEEFNDIAGTSLDIFPNEIVDLVISRYERTPKPEMVQKKSARIYIHHEMNRWKQNAELEKMEQIGLLFARIETCRDRRVCSECQSHFGIIYSINDIPELPLCWECRCFYSPIFNFEDIEWPALVFRKGKVERMTEAKFRRKFKVEDDPE